MSQIDWDALLKPISEEVPCGPNLEEIDSDLHWRILEARRDAKSEEDAKSDKAESQWKKLEKLCLENLNKHSKDLRYVAFLIEASLRTGGIDGISDGLDVATKLVETFQDQLHPKTDNGWDDTVLPLNQLDGKLLEQPMRMLTITRGSQKQHQLWQLAYSQELEQRSAEEKEAAALQNQASFSEIKTAANETPVDFFLALRDAVIRCRETIDTANNTFAQKAGKRLTSFSKIRAVLDSLDSAINTLAGHRMPANKSEAAASAPDPQPAGASSSTPAVAETRAPGALANRQDAFRQLTSIAEFFEKTEPQSVIPAQLRRVIKWGNMSPAELYLELIDDSNARSSMYRLIGLETPASAN